MNSKEEEKIKKALASPTHLILVAYPEGGSVVHHVFVSDMSMSELVATLELVKFEMLRGVEVRRPKTEARKAKKDEQP